MRTSHSPARLRRIGAPGLAAALVTVGLVATDSVDAAPAAAPVSSCVSTDNGDPTLSSLAFTPSTVDVTSGAKTVAFTVGATDTGGPGAASGIGSAYLSLYSPDFQRSAFVTLKKNTAGSWVGNATIPRWTHSGAWKVNYLSVSDKAGQSRYWNTNELTALGFPTTLDVTATPDDTAPNLNAFTFTPGAVDTRTSARTVTFTAKATDGQSGIASLYVSASEPSTNHRGFAVLSKVAGTASTYRGRMTIQRWMTNGTWHVDSVSTNDRAGNYRSWTYAQLGTAGFKRNLTVVSGSDSSKPTLASFARTPASVDVRTSNKSVTATLRAKDTGAGVSYVAVSFSGPNGFATSLAMRRVSGSANNGVWKGTGTIARCRSSQGAWTARVFVVDLVGNQKEYTASALASKGWPSKVTVTAGDHVVPTVTGPSSVAPADDVTLQFNEAVNGITADSATLRVYDFPTPGPVLPGTWTCQEAGGGATSCTTGQVRTAVFNPTADLNPFENYVVELNPEHQLGVTDLAGNPFDRREVTFFTSE